MKLTSQFSSATRNFSLNDTGRKKLFNSTVVFLLLISSAVIGLLCVFSPWYYIIGFVVAIAFPIFIWIYPWAGIILYSIISVILPDLKFADVLTVVVLAIFWIKLIAVPVENKLPDNYSKILYIFYFFVFVSLILALIFFNNTIPYIYRDGRFFIYWLWFPVIYRLTNNSLDGFVKIGRTIVALTVFVVIFAIFQWITTIQIIAGGRVASLETNGQYDSSLTRVQMSGFVFVLMSIVWMITAFVYEKKKWWQAGPVILILTLAIYVNFGRALWFWTVAAVFFSFFFIGLGRLFKTLIALIIMIISVMSLLNIFEPNAMTGAAERIMSISEEGGNRTSFGWRKLENELAIANIIKSPIIGVGIGGEYRKWLGELRTFEEHTRYVHNSYIFIALKLGLPALIILLWLLVLSWIEGVRQLRTIPDQDRPLKIAALSALPAILGLSSTQPELMNTFSIIFITIVMVILIHKKPSTLDVQPEVKNAREPSYVKRLKI